MGDYGDTYFLVDKKFWETLESFYELQLPVYLKNVLSANGYGSLSSFPKITSSSFEDMEATIRSFYQSGEKGSADTLHLYRDSPALFKIVPGHRELVLEYSGQLSSQQNEFRQFLLSSSLPKPSSSRSSQQNYHDASHDASSHVRIIKQLINMSIKIPEGADLVVRIVNSDSARVCCFQCDQEIEVKTRNLSPTNRQWMIGKYVNHIELHSSSQDRRCSIDENDSDDETAFSDELDRRVLELIHRPKVSESSSKPSMTRSMKRNVKMTTEMAHDSKQRKITQFFTSTTSTPPEVVEYLPRAAAEDDSQQLLALLEKLPLTSMVKTIIRETINNGYKNMLTKQSEAKGARYTVETKNIGAYLYLMGGRKDYEELVVNLGLPSLSTILRHIHKSCNKIVEGQLRIEQLLQFLEARSLPKAVFISEDGTKITTRVKYDIENDQIAGLCPKLNENGMPAVESYPAKTPELIKYHGQSEKLNRVCDTGYTDGTKNSFFQPAQFRNGQQVYYR